MGKNVTKTLNFHNKKIKIFLALKSWEPRKS